MVESRSRTGGYLYRETSRSNSPRTMRYIDMRRDIFTSNIICNRLDFETLLGPIVYFIGIGKPLCIPPPRTVHDNFPLIRLKQKYFLFYSFTVSISSWLIYLFSSVAFLSDLSPYLIYSISISFPNIERDYLVQTLIKIIKP